MSALQPATLDQYLTWLRAWIDAGNQPTHYYDYPFARQTWLTAERDFTTGGECGSNAVRIIVPAGVRHLGGELGHNELYLLEGPAQQGGVVPVFSDASFLALPGVAEFIATKRRADQEFERERLAAERERKRLAEGSDVTDWLSSRR